MKLSKVMGISFSQFAMLPLASSLIVFVSPPRAFAENLCSQVFTSSKINLELKMIMDISRTGQAHSYVTQVKSKADIVHAIELAKQNGLKITIKGTNHSHGGHNRRSEVNGSPRAIQLDTTYFNKILNFNPEKSEITVEPGLTWRDLSIYLNDYGFASRTEQSSNIFSIGGSVSTNVHGRDVHGPLVNSIKDIKYMDSNGVEHITSLNHNPDAFRAIVGGYGAIGIITAVTLKIEKNYLYEAKTTKDLDVDDYTKYVRALQYKSENIMHYARVTTVGKEAFSKISVLEWKPIPNSSEPRTWAGWKLNLEEKNRWISSAIMNMMRYNPTSNFGKNIKDLMDKAFGFPKTGTRKTKNNILNNPVQFLFDNFYNQKESVDILQEYFIPSANLSSFLKDLQSITNKHELNLLNVTLRYVPKLDRNKDGILSPYSDKEDQIAVVLYFNINEKSGLNNGDLVAYDGSLWTQELIQSAQNYQGTFYWPYHRWWSDQQILKNDKENIKQFFLLKDKIDPENLFESDFSSHLRKTLTNAEKSPF